VAPQPFYQDRGTPIALLHVLRALSELGYTVDVLTYPLGASMPNPHVRYYRIANPFHFKHIRIGFSCKKVFLDLLLFWKLRRILGQIHYDVIHAVEEAAYLAALVARKHKIPIIYDMQSSMAEQLSRHAFFQYLPLRPFWDCCERWLIRRMPIIGCSAGLRERVKAIHPEAFMREWHYPHVAVRQTKTDAASLRQALHIAPDAPVIVYTGTFESYQGLDLLVAAIPLVLAKHPHAVFVIVGGTPGDLAKQEQQLAAHAPLSAYRLLARQPKHLMPVFHAMATVLVSPRTFGDNLPLKILEYLGAHRPIVATSIPGHRIMLNNELALLTAATPPAFAAGIIRMLQDPALAAAYQNAAAAFAKTHLGWNRFCLTVQELYAEAARRHPEAAQPMKKLGYHTISVIIPARNAAGLIEDTLKKVMEQKPDGAEFEVLVIDDGSTDQTASLAHQMEAGVVTVRDSGGNPARARNIGAREATGDLLVFLDVDCTPEPGWLEAHLKAHEHGYRCVGGALSMPEALPYVARLDYYCGWYHVHPRQAARLIFHHPPCNLSIERSLFLQTSGFTEQQPIAYAHEELQWQQELYASGIPIHFEPRAAAAHWNRDGFGNLLRRNYRWAYSAIESKAGNQTVRLAWLYRSPWLSVLMAIPLIPVQAAYIVACWLRAGVWEPLWSFPFILAARAAYGFGMFAGGVRWLTNSGRVRERKPRGRS
jgi:glycosyltransferase involved in cell wall biosynthesis